MQKELSKKYNPAEFEDKIYSEWQDKGYFKPNGNKTKPSFSIVMPPPNITGQLHMGHALDNTLQDILTRYKRMCGCNTLWLPGTDHASIATEAKIVEAMKKEGITKDDIGRDGFLERAWEWNKVYGGRIIEQLKKIGSSCDWTRTRFTLDEGCSEAVQEVFIRLYEKGLIYRGIRIINWCPHCITSISDAEVEYEDQAGHFWHIRYPLSNGSGFVYLATTRPETLLGDTAVAVNPNDERYKHLIGKTVILPLVGREIPIVGDEYVEMDFGTGVVKITPAHDPNDFEVGTRHNLPLENMMTDDAKITDNYPRYAGMDRYEARKVIIKDLEEGGFLVKTEEHAHNVGTCYRCGITIEPRASKQWFVKMESLAKPAIEAVKSGDIKFIPERFDKNYLHWMENIHDWCISRQLWWGHRIPAFYCDDCGELVVTKVENPTCKHCGKPMRQDPDTLDTWFSSALWPFSTMGWPKDTEDLKDFYPTSVLVTGYDIITFWVSRMIFSGLEYTGNKPFSDVLIHGLIRDSQGRKMSKSLGNGIDPLELIETYGADALRFTLATGNSPGNDMRFYTERVEASRNFANKIWNATRFILMNIDDEASSDSIDLSILEDEDKWLLSLYNRLITEVCENLDRYELGIAVSKLYDFIWDIFCDWYIELVKGRLNDKGSTTNKAAQNTLTYVMSNTLKLLHPFMPFITEEIWQTLPHSGDSIMISAFPVNKKEFDFPMQEENMRVIIDSIRAIRNRRTEMNVPPSKKAKVYIKTDKEAFFTGKEHFFTRLAGASQVELTQRAFTENSVQIITDTAEIYIPMSDIIDFAAEKERLTKELEEAVKEINRATSKLNNSEFTGRAPEKVVSAEKEKVVKYTAISNKIKEALEKL
ncbi:MAG: valine--tRNA ligase [Clostridiales bacterium GWF2_36_10]|nr:MAG: valine--tRNA ligase [Clostridiales bacterium GWF2_36_10]HAN20552.1 valine--tRNA ligase [Clostridiales bacterium]